MKEKNREIKLEIRPAEEADLEQICAIEKDSFGEPWSIDSFRSNLSLETSDFYAALDQDGDVMGYFVLYFSLDEGELETIAVRRGYRGCHIGQKLMDKLFECGRARKLEKIFLEVRPSNEAARALYRKNGFLRVGVRKNFYRFPAEDAIVGMKQLD